jgi:hypothetical protein
MRFFICLSVNIKCFARRLGRLSFYKNKETVCIKKKLMISKRVFRKTGYNLVKSSPFDPSTLRPFDLSTLRPFDPSTLRPFDKLRTSKLRTSKLRTSKLRTSKLRTSKLRTSKLRTSKLRTSKLRTSSSGQAGSVRWRG